MPNLVALRKNARSGLFSVLSDPTIWNYMTLMSIHITLLLIHTYQSLLTTAYSVSLQPISLLYNGFLKHVSLGMMATAKQRL